MPSDYKSSPMSKILSDVFKKKKIPRPGVLCAGAIADLSPPLGTWGPRGARSDPEVSPPARPGPARRGRASPRAPGMLPVFPSRARFPTLEPGARRTAVAEGRRQRSVGTGTATRHCPGETPARPRCTTTASPPPPSPLLAKNVAPGRLAGLGPPLGG